MPLVAFASFLSVTFNPHFVVVIVVVVVVVVTYLCPFIIRVNVSECNSMAPWHVSCVITMTLGNTLLLYCIIVLL